MGSSNSVPTNMQGTYLEQCKNDIMENTSTEFSYKLIHKEKELEFTQTQKDINKNSEGGASINVAKMALFEGLVKKEEVEKEIILKFNTKNASFQEGGGKMGGWEDGTSSS
jgi:hypothetical protein